MILLFNMLTIADFLLWRRTTHMYGNLYYETSKYFVMIDAHTNQEESNCWLDFTAKDKITYVLFTRNLIYNLMDMDYL